MTDAELIQGSAGWHEARLGSLGASRVHDAVAKIKSGAYSANRAIILGELLAERLSGQLTDHYVSAPMQWGKDHEAEARRAYEQRTGLEVYECGLIRHPEIAGSHASPDGLVTDAGLVELKCPTTKTHLELLYSGQIDLGHIVQMEWQMACTGRSWCDYASYDPRLPESLRLFVHRLPRDESLILQLEVEVTRFLADLDEREQTIRRRMQAA